MSIPSDNLHMKNLSIEMYEKLYMVRRAEEFIIQHYPDNEMKTPMHMSMGQEAIAVGVCQALGPENQIWTSYRSHAAFLAKTKAVDRFFAELYGKVTGTAEGIAGSMHLADPSKGYMSASAVVGSVIPAAVGMAFANKRAGNGRISCVFFGDGALDEGVFWESLNVASVMQLPVLFVCEDNGLAQHTSAQDRHGFRSIVELVSGFDSTVLEDDTTDVERIYAHTERAMEAIFSTGKPTFLYLKCYRYLEHVGIYEDFDAGYRCRSEYEEWRVRDCVELQRMRLLDRGVSEDEIRHFESRIDEEIRTSIRLAQEAPVPQPQALYRGLFHEGD
jgi:TPP-dependent pyruvate/acetoin dehydrogenase alpha subunit